MGTCTGVGGDVAGAADDEAAHAVPDEHEPADAAPGRAPEVAQDPGELLAVAGDRQPGVVANVERHVAELSGERVGIERAAAGPPCRAFAPSFAGTW